MKLKSGDLVRFMTYEECNTVGGSDSYADWRLFQESYENRIGLVVDLPARPQYAPVIDVMLDGRTILYPTRFLSAISDQRV